MSLDTFIRFVLPGIISFIYPTIKLLFLDKDAKQDIDFYVFLYFCALFPILNCIASVIYFLLLIYYSVKILLLKIIEKREVNVNKQKEKKLDEIQKYKKLKKELINYKYFENEQAIENFIVGTEIICKFTNNQDDNDCDWNEF